MWPLLGALVALAAGCGGTGEVEPVDGAGADESAGADGNAGPDGSGPDGTGPDAYADDVAPAEDDPFAAEAALMTATSSLRVRTSDGHPLLAYDPMTLDECDRHFPDASKATDWWRLNHYSSCWVAEPKIEFLMPGTLGVKGAVHFRQVVVVHGGINTRPGRPVRKARVLIRTRPLPPYPGSVPPAYVQAANVTFSVQCSPDCTVSGGGRTSAPLATWTSVPRSYETTLTMSGTGAAGDLDHKTWHGISLRMSVGAGLYPVTDRSPEESIRCDTANYNYHFWERAWDNGACTFAHMDAVLHYSGAQIASVTRHIWNAQHTPVRTEPTFHEWDRGADIIIPGDRQRWQAWPLHRLVVTRDDRFKNRERSARNRALKDVTCRRYWPGYPRLTVYPSNALNGPNPCVDPGTPMVVRTRYGQTMDCDEYPFASTYEGAAAYEYHLKPNGRPGDPPGNPAHYSYSACPLDLSQNRSAGATLGHWYARDHILEKDPFWVAVPQP